MAGTLDDIRDASRAAVHAKFALPAVVYAADGSVITAEAHVRLHSEDSRAFGDLDREGFAFQVEQKNILVVDTEEFTPQHAHYVDLGRGRVYDIDHVLDSIDRGRFVRCVATERKP